VTAQVMPECEAFSLEGGPLGLLLLHGWSGNPSSLRPMGEWLAERGYTVLCPRMPGHGTTWDDLEKRKWTEWTGEAERAFADIASRCQTVVAAGLSVGSALAFHLAAGQPDRLAGVVAISPYLVEPRLRFAPVVRLFRRTVKGIGNDIKKAGQDEHPYDRLPVVGLGQLGKLLSEVTRELPLVGVPVLVLASPQDHVARRGTVEYVMERLGTEDKELVVLPDSYHVATLDNDAETIFERTHEFATRLAKAATPPPRRRRRTGEGGRRQARPRS
jgi:carboxylesterase